MTAAESIHDEADLELSEEEESMNGNSSAKP
jgi:hypothetical protein